MFKKSITLTELKQEPIKSLSDLHKPSSKDVIQVLHKGSAIKVLMTQEHYFELLHKIEAYEPSPTKPVGGKFDTEAMAEQFKQDLKRVE